MFTKFKRETVTLLLDPLNEQEIEYDRSKKVRIILSPALYWVKRVALPIKYLYQVKKLIPSIFEDILPEVKYTFTAYKDGDEYLLFAYQDIQILKLLKLNSINPADVASIHFAQNELLDETRAYAINKTQSIYTKDDTLVLVPTDWLEESAVLNLEDVQLSNKTIKLQQYGHIVDNNSLYKIVAILVALVVIVTMENFITSSKADKIAQEKNKLTSKYKLQATMMQNRSTLRKYDKIYRTQNSLRDRISNVLSTRLDKGQSIELVEYKEKVLNVSIAGITKNRASKLLNTLKSKKINFKESYTKNGVKLEMKI